jgi:hypothetical protein
MSCEYVASRDLASRGGGTTIVSVPVLIALSRLLYAFNCACCYACEFATVTQSVYTAGRIFMSCVFLAFPERLWPDAMKCLDTLLNLSSAERPNISFIVTLSNSVCKMMRPFPEPE